MDDRPNRGRPLPPIETRWKKGESGNPRGRPKKKDSLTDALRELLQEACLTDAEKRSWGELFVHSRLRQALKGDAMAAKEIWDRHDGKIPLPDSDLSKDAGDKEIPETSIVGQASHTKLPRETLNKIRELYGLPQLDPEPERANSEGAEKEDSE